MVAELTSIPAAAASSTKSVCSSERQSTLPRWLQTATRDNERNVQQMYAGVSKIPKNNGIGYMARPGAGDRSDGFVGGDPPGLLSRPGSRSVVGLVGPYRGDVDDSMEGCERVVNGESPENPQRNYVLRDEELVEESEFRRMHPTSSTPGRENWRLQESQRLKGVGPEENGVLSMTDIWPKDWGLYNEQPEQDSLNEQSSCPERQSSAGATPGLGTKHRYRGSKLGPGRTLLGILSPGRSSASEMFDYKEPFSSLWILLSSLYGRLIIILMLAFCLTEVMDNSVKLLSLQGIFLMYLYVGSIAVIICIYIWVLIDSCASLNSHGDMKAAHVHGMRVGMAPANITTSVMDRDAELGGFGFGSLKKAHISRARTSATSFYLRVGALAFGLGTLVFNGLEMAMHSMMEGPCLSDVVFVHPVLHGLFTFLQMHFLFVNSQVLVERFGLAARFGFMHLAATNLALWIRLIVWESGNEWTYFIYLAQSVPDIGSSVSSNIPTPLQLRGFPRSMISRHERDLSFVNVTSHHVYRPVSNSHISQVVALHECLNTNSLGQLWTSSMPFLYPFIVQFSLIAAAVTFVMGQNVGKGRMLLRQKKFNNNNSLKCSPTTTVPERSMGNSLSVDCSGASKGLFLGLLCMVSGIVIIIIFLVVKEDIEFPTDTIFWMTMGALTAILSISFVMTIVGLWQIRRLSVDGYEPSMLDSLLSTITTTGVLIYTIFGILVGASGLANSNASALHGHHGMLLAVSLLQLLQASSQSTLISEALRRASLTRHQMLLKPGRQVITFLLCTNAVLWGYDTFVTQSWMSQELQLRFYGVLAWGVISRIGLPLLVFYRFHSCVLLLEVWKRSYRTPLLDPGN